MDGFIEEVVAIADAVAARRRSAKRIMLSFDEWNVWYRTRRRPEDRVKPGWPVAPRDPRGASTPCADALAFGGICIALLNHADRVKAACLAQLVNVIAPIMTETGGPAWRQTIFHPFAHMSNLGRGRVLRAQIDAPTYAASYYDPRGAEEHRFRAAGSAVPEARRGARRAARQPHPVRAQPQPGRGAAAGGDGAGVLGTCAWRRRSRCTTAISTPPTPRTSRSGSGLRRSKASRSRVTACAPGCRPPRGTSSGSRPAG